MTALDTTRAAGGLRLSTYVRGDYSVAALSGELDIACAPVLREQLLAMLRPQASRLVIDLSRVRFCDASGLAVLVGTDRRARLLGGVLRLAAPSPPVTAALCATGLNLLLDIFPTLSAAIAGAQDSQRVHGGGVNKPVTLALAPGADPDADDLHEAVTAVLAHADAWRDADPNRRFTLMLRALARAHVGLDRAALIEAARSLLIALTRYPLTHSPSVAATATGLRRVLEPRPRPPALT